MLTKTHPRATNGASMETELLICMDSNSKYLKREKIWNPRTTTWKHTANINEAAKVISNCATAPKCFLIQTGVNDTDSKAGHLVASELIALIRKIRHKFGDVRIVLSEITPRNDRGDSVVMEANAIIKQQLANDKCTFLVNYDRIRSGSAADYLALFDDNGNDERHFSPHSIRRLAARLKGGLRWAFEIPSKYVYHAPQTRSTQTSTNTNPPYLRDIQTGFHLNNQRYSMNTQLPDNNKNLKNILSQLVSVIHHMQ